jgi:hypothetical protein
MGVRPLLCPTLYHYGMAMPVVQGRLTTHTSLDWRLYTFVHTGKIICRGKVSPDSMPPRGGFLCGLEGVEHLHDARGRAVRTNRDYGRSAGHRKGAPGIGASGESSRSALRQHSARAHFATSPSAMSIIAPCSQAQIVS